jgi:hypothetical protein
LFRGLHSFFSEIRFIEFYSRKYQIDIQDTSQPLLVSNGSMSSLLPLSQKYKGQQQQQQQSEQDDEDCHRQAQQKSEHGELQEVPLCQDDVAKSSRRPQYQLLVPELCWLLGWCFTSLHVVREHSILSSNELCSSYTRDDI